MGPAWFRMPESPHTFHWSTGRVLLISFLSIVLAVIAACVADILLRLIQLITNLSFHGHLTGDGVPTVSHVGAFVIVIPVIGAVIVGFMARYGSAGIRGHGIPEAMEQVLTRQSRIPARLMFLKPLSAAIAIGTGGPFGAEGPIIATGGAMGSVVGQILKTTAAERKTLLAAGAAAGMAATFGTSVSAVLLAIELLLFEFRPRSFIPVALASTTAAGMRFLFDMPYPVFPMPVLHHSPGLALAVYIGIAAIIGIASVFVTHAVYAVEDAFELLPIHWMWWPAIAGRGRWRHWIYLPPNPRSGLLQHQRCDLKLASSEGHGGAVRFEAHFLGDSRLGSGTSGGTLAQPLFTIGSTLELRHSRNCRGSLDAKTERRSASVAAAGGDGGDVRRGFGGRLLADSVVFACRDHASTAGIAAAVGRMRQPRRISSRRP